MGLPLTPGEGDGIRAGMDGSTSPGYALGQLQGSLCQSIVRYHRINQANPC